jgi:hypothetical protein
VRPEVAARGPAAPPHAAPRPGAFVVGAPRCGTTALVSFLGQHPEVFVPYVKEPHHFGRDLTGRRGFEREDDYLALFAEAGERLALEGSTWYLYSRTAAREIHAFSPDARIVVMLRDPVQLLRSWHAHVVLLGIEDIEDFAEALAAEGARAEGQGLRQDASIEKLRYRRIPRFAEQLERYFDTFGRERVLVVLHEDFRRDNAGTVARVFEFLGVDPGFVPSFETVNAHAGVRSRTVRRLIEHQPEAVRALVRRLLPARTRHALRDRLRQANTQPRAREAGDAALDAALRTEFAPEVERLEALLGRDLSAWRNGPAPA